MPKSETHLQTNRASSAVKPRHNDPARDRRYTVALARGRCTKILILNSLKNCWKTFERSIDPKIKGDTVTGIPHSYDMSRTLAACARRSKACNIHYIERKWSFRIQAGRSSGAMDAMSRDNGSLYRDFLVLNS